MTKNTLPSLDGLSPEDMYFELQAYLGTTKHMGGYDTTKTLIDLCHISQHTVVLDVGCGAGACPGDFSIISAMDSPWANANLIEKRVYFIRRGYE